MNLLMELWNHPLTHHAGWVLVHSLWQGAMVAAIFGVVRFSLRGASANARYLAGCLSLLLLAAAPLVTFLAMQTSTDPLHPVKAATAVSRPTPPASVFNGLDGLKAGNVASSALQRTAEIVERIAPWLTAAWFAGVAVFSVRLFHGLRRVRALRTNGIEPLGPGWAETLHALKRRLNLSRPVLLFKSALVEVPMVVGWLRPVILLPASSVTGLSPSQLEAILAHELAHVCRHDYLVNVFQNIVETLMFYHPAVWWISRCIRVEREHCCDDVAVTVCGNRTAYARALATMEELRAAPRFAFGAGGGSLRDRIRRLLGLPASAPETGSRPLGLALMGVGVVLVILGAAVLLAPPKYQASARIRIKRVAQQPTPPGRESFDSTSEPYVMQTEVEVIQSPLILNRVIEDLHLTQKWGERLRGGGELPPPDALAHLKRKLGVRLIPNTSLMRIEAYSDDPAEAQSIANEIAQTYRQHRLEQTALMSSNGIAALKIQLADQESKVHNAQSNVDWLRTEYKISDTDPMSPTPRPMLSVDTMKQLAAEVIYLESERIKQERQLKQLTDMDRKELRNVIQTALDQPDGELSRLLAELDAAQQNLIVVARDFTPLSEYHSNALQVVRALDEKIDRKTAAILMGLQTKLDMTTAKAQKLRETLDNATMNDLAAIERSRPYYTAKQELLEQMNFKQILQLKISQETADLKLPRESEVEIVESAVRPLEPVSPNRVLGIALLASGVLLGLAGLATSKRKGISAPAASA